MQEFFISNHEKIYKYHMIFAVFPNMSVLSLRVYILSGFVTAVKAVVYVIGYKADVESAGAAERSFSSGDIDIFGKNEFYASYGYVAAALACVSRNGQGLESPFVLFAAFIRFVQYNCERYAFVWADIAKRNVYLNYPAERIQIYISCIEFYRVVAAVRSKFDRFRA